MCACVSGFECVGVFAVLLMGPDLGRPYVCQAQSVEWKCFVQPEKRYATDEFRTGSEVGLLVEEG